MMKKQSLMGYLAVLGLLLSGTDGALAQAPDPGMQSATPDRAQLAKRLESVKALLETSSAAKQIEASGDSAAKAERAKAFELWNEAKAAFDAGDLAVTQKLLIEAPKMLFSAARHSAPEQVSAEKLKNDYASRRESVKALIAAQNRIADEKGKAAGADLVSKSVETLMNEAEQLAAAGKYADARAQADKAYLLAKASVGDLRGGDTVVRSLNFANKAEEYKYEHDRNDSLAMLYKVLVEQKGTPKADVLDQVKKGTELRAQAEKAADSGDHEKGVKLLEEASGQLIRAIRSAGIFIPG